MLTSARVICESNNFNDELMIKVNERNKSSLARCDRIPLLSFEVPHPCIQAKGAG